MNATAMDEDAISKAALDAVMALMNQYQGKRQRSDALSGVMIVAYQLLRAVEGDKFVTGWLESALKDVANNPPAFEIRRLN